MWKTLIRKNFTDWKKLADFLELNEEQRAAISKSQPFPLNVPLRLAEKIVKETLDDPILRQFLPLKEEEDNSVNFQKDALQEKEYQIGPRLLKKYAGRALLVCTSACVMNCRFCFRRHYDYDVGNSSFVHELQAIAEDPSIHEVLLSGGDPLSMTNPILEKLLLSLNQIPHVRRIRFHTRYPIGIPERLDDDFIAILKALRPSLWFVLHCNHPKELDAEIIERLGRLRCAGIVLLSQTVLLKGVNDDVVTLKDLCEKLVDSGIVPYYLHQLDRVEGTAHFEVSEQRGRELVSALAKELPGYAVPRYVREIPGETGKTPL